MKHTRRPAQKSRGLFFVMVAMTMLYGTIVPHVGAAVAFVALAYGLALCPYRLAVNRVTRFIGTVSFSAYIWHFWLLHYVTTPWVYRLKIFAPHADVQRESLRGSMRFVLLYLATLAVTLPVAALTYYLIEVPGQNVGKKLITRMGWGKRPRREGSAGISEAVSVAHSKRVTTGGISPLAPVLRGEG